MQHNNLISQSSKPGQSIQQHFKIFLQQNPQFAQAFEILNMHSSTLATRLQTAVNLKLNHPQLTSIRLNLPKSFNFSQECLKPSLIIIEWLRPYSLCMSERYIWRANTHKIENNNNKVISDLYDSPLLELLFKLIEYDFLYSIDLSKTGIEEYQFRWKDFCTLLSKSSIIHLVVIDNGLNSEKIKELTEIIIKNRLKISSQILSSKLDPAVDALANSIQHYDFLSNRQQTLQNLADNNNNNSVIPKLHDTALIEKLEQLLEKNPVISEPEQLADSTRRNASDMDTSDLTRKQIKPNN